ncbi:fluoride efflux transporter CrcB [Bacillus sp. FJAT-44742]|uniref:fluoride efflux transporter CrcB n=1 Tax=Bacillus sp. FJAT-44742 TaxID=2014005 RepID=UPI000C2325E0|nr:fluoride efflux transporter CrcB [Bacillus sp. FJAT-44742]
MNLFLLSAGGAIGAISRYLLGKVIMKQFPSPPFPLAMLVVNILGSLGLGLFFGIYFGGIPLGAYEDPYFLAIGIGFFGAFTTFSTFSVEAFTLLENRKLKALFIYTSLSVAGSIITFALAYYIGLSLY